jgi:CRISPR-associated protein Csc2
MEESKMSKAYQNIESQLQTFLGRDYGRFFHGDWADEKQPPRDFRISLVTLLETQDYAIFQSEPHRLDKVTLARGITTSGTIERVECHESKPKQEIRRVGKREMRKLLGDVDISETDDNGNAVQRTVSYITTADDSTDRMVRECHIPDCLCGECRDCRLWGFAASGGDETGKPSRIDVGTAYSIRAVDEINRERTWNAVDESVRHVQRAVGEKEQVQPEVFIPYVLDARDVNLDEFLYLLYSILNAGRVGAGRTKYGAIRLRPLALFFAHEQLFSNKRLTQHAYDKLYSGRQAQMNERAQRLGWLGELTLAEAQGAISHAVTQELNDAACWYQQMPVDGFSSLLSEAKSLFRDREAMRNIVDNGARS